MISALEMFAWNQARFVYHAHYTIERMELCEGVSYREAFRRIKATPMGRKYLKNVSIKEMRKEDKRPGSFMNANTIFGHWIGDDYGTYVEDFVEQ